MSNNATTTAAVDPTRDPAATLAAPHSGVFATWEASAA